MINEIFRRLVQFSATVAVESKVKSTSKDEKNSLCRPSELPIYSEEDNLEEKVDQQDDTEDVVLQYLENVVLKTHQKYTDLRADFEILKEDGIDSYKRAKGKMGAFLEYLRREENLNQRIGFISFGTIIGLLFGIKKGVFRKLCFATTGGTAAAAVCYPQEAKEYGNIAYTEIKELLQDSYELYKEANGVTTKEDANGESVEVKDPVEVIKESHEEAVTKSCHCPIGSCLHRSEEIPSSSEENKEISSNDNTVLE